MKRYLTILLCAAMITSAATASAIDIKAREYILVDYQTGTVLDAKDPDKRMPPSSMSKLMTGYMVFGALKSGKLSLEDQLSVSRNAWQIGGAATGGSTMFLDPGAMVKVEDLLRGMIVQSGNDACVVLAEGVSGSEEEFARQMNAKAKELGMTNSNFVNSTGLPDEQHYMTPRDLAILAKHLIAEFPEYYSLYSETSFTYNNITQGNRNPLLYRVGSGADGLKTGHTSIAGYGLTASAIRNGRRLILVANGMNSLKDRDEETSKLLDWGFREFTNRELFKAGDLVTTAEVWLGDAPEVNLVIPRDVIITVPRSASQALDVKVVYQGPLPAPIAKDTEIAKVIITAKDLEPIEVPLRAGSDVGRLGFIGRLKAAAQYIFLGPPDMPNGGKAVDVPAPPGATSGASAPKPAN
ncbi:MAG: D-alanyl-D-alanine carboxypeptidase [Rhodospirillaceae bacterium]|nr:D-alanyl-D-alanine carboxypeptidase [Rhodospirillaceae bacterium]